MYNALLFSVAFVLVLLLIDARRRARRRRQYFERHWRGFLRQHAYDPDLEHDMRLKRRFWEIWSQWEEEESRRRERY